MTIPKQIYERVKNHKFWKLFYAVSIFLGLALMVFEIKIYRQTIINTSIPILIILIIGLLTYYFNRRHYKRTYSLSVNFFPIIQSMISWGFISCYIFMASNYYFADKKAIEYRFKIKEKSSMSGSKRNRNERKPLVLVDYFNQEKELVFSYLDTEKVNKADSALMTVRKGLLGFDIINNYDVFN